MATTRKLLDDEVYCLTPEILKDTQNDAFSEEDITNEFRYTNTDPDILRKDVNRDVLIQGESLRDRFPNVSSDKNLTVELQNKYGFTEKEIENLKKSYSQGLTAVIANAITTSLDIETEHASSEDQRKVEIYKHYGNIYYKVYSNYQIITTDTNETKNFPAEAIFKLTNKGEFELLQITTRNKELCARIMKGNKWKEEMNFNPMIRKTINTYCYIPNIEKSLTEYADGYIKMHGHTTSQIDIFLQKLTPFDQRKIIPAQQKGIFINQAKIKGDQILKYISDYYPHITIEIYKKMTANKTSVDENTFIANITLLANLKRPDLAYCILTQQKIDQNPTIPSSSEILKKLSEKNIKKAYAILYPSPKKPDQKTISRLTNLPSDEDK